jgi:hypothetical protein
MHAEKKTSLHFEQQSSVDSEKIDVTNNTLSGCELHVVHFVTINLGHMHWPQVQVKTTQQLSE